MNSIFFFPWPWLATALAACLLGAPAAQAQTITNTGDLSFGSFVAGTGGAVVMGFNDARSGTGGVMLLPQGGGTAARFNVTGDFGKTYVITLPATAALSDGNNHSMAINEFSSSLGVTGTLSLGGTQSLSVGATLTVSAAQQPGSYTGSFAVTINYE